MFYRMFYRCPRYAKWRYESTTDGEPRSWFVGSQVVNWMLHPPIVIIAVAGESIIDVAMMFPAKGCPSDRGYPLVN